MTTSLTYPFPAPPSPGQRIEVAPGLWWLRFALPFALDHINLWLLEDKKENDTPTWTLVDTGYGLPATQDVWEALLTNLPGRIRRIVVTHFHPDHIGMAHWLQERCGATVLMSAAEYLTAHAVWNEIAGHGSDPMLAQFRSHGLDAERCAAQDKRRGFYRRGVPSLPSTYQRLIEGETLVIGHRHWTVHLGYGHSPEHVSLHCEKDKLLISGDMLLPKISTNISVFAVTPQLNALKLYLDSLARWNSLPDETLILPSHGLPFGGIRARIDQLDQHHQERLALLEQSCQQPRSAAELLATLFPRSLDDHQVMFAMGEAIAHLNFLEQDEKLMRIAGSDGIIRFLQRTDPVDG